MMATHRSRWNTVVKLSASARTVHDTELAARTRAALSGPGITIALETDATLGKRLFSWVSKTICGLARKKPTKTSPSRPSGTRTFANVEERSSMVVEASAKYFMMTDWGVLLAEFSRIRC